MARLSDVSHRREQNPQIKPDELENRRFQVIDCTLPITPKKPGKYEPRPFVVFTVVLESPTPEEVEAGGVFDLLLSYHEQGQRADLCRYFNDPDNTPEPIGPLTMVKLDVGQPKPMWAFADADPEPEPEPVKTGNGRKAKS